MRHRVAAALRPDEKLARDLERAARTEAGRGAGAAAASLWLDASRLSPGDTGRDRTLLEAVEAMFADGKFMAAAPYLETVSAMAESPRRDLVLARAALLHGAIEEAERLLDGAWRQCDPQSDQRLACAIAESSAI